MGILGTTEQKPLQIIKQTEGKQAALPEVFVPSKSDTIIANHALGGTTNVVVNVDASGSAVEGDDQSANQLGEVIAAVVQSELVRQQMSGGLLS